MLALFSLSVSRVMQFFGPSLVTAASSVLTPASNARLPSFDMIPLIKSPAGALSHDIQYEESEPQIHIMGHGVSGCFGTRLAPQDLMRNTGKV